MELVYGYLIRLAERQQVTFRFIFNYKILTLASSQLSGSRLLGIEMVETSLASNNLAVLGKFQSL